MEYRCEDLPKYGVVLVPPSSPEFAALFAGVMKRVENPLPGSRPRVPQFESPEAPAMVLRNQARQSIASLAWKWTFEPEYGRRGGASVSMIALPNVLAPFGLDDRARMLHGYWDTIFPGSNRVIRGNALLGDNTDIRPPQPGEMWTGGIAGVGGASRVPPGPTQIVTLAIDGVFFLDGGFAGPDTLGSFDRFTAGVAAHLEAGKIAREGHNNGTPSSAILDRIQTLTGPGLQTIADQIANMRKYSSFGDDRIVYQLMSWSETPLPTFRKL
jgi:hypothetical protein